MFGQTFILIHFNLLNISLRQLNLSVSLSAQCSVHILFICVLIACRSHPSISCVPCTFFISLLFYICPCINPFLSLYPSLFNTNVSVSLSAYMAQLFLFLFLFRYLFLAQIFLFSVSVILSVSGTNIPFYCFCNSNLFLSLHQFCLFINCPTPSVSFTSMVSFTSSVSFTPSRDIFQSTVSVTTSVSINYLFM